MAIVGDTGNGATLTLATTGWTGAITGISIGEMSVDMLDVSLLATTGQMLEIATALASNPEVTVDFVFDTSEAQVVPGSVAETATITFPQRTGESTAANIAGTAQVTALKYPDLKNGEVQSGQFKFKYNGDTGPTLTVST